MALESADSKNKSNQDKLADVHWDIRGPGQIVPKYGDDGKVAGGTTKDLEAGWAATNFGRIMRKLDAQDALLTQLALKQGVVIDYQAIAKAVVDEEAKRLTAPTAPAPGN